MRPYENLLDHATTAVKTMTHEHNLAIKAKSDLAISESKRSEALSLQKKLTQEVQHL
jgi:hypothetical protein